jgi:hypothetical protein
MDRAVVSPVTAGRPRRPTASPSSPLGRSLDSVRDPTLRPRVRPRSLHPCRAAPVASSVSPSSRALDRTAAATVSGASLAGATQVDFGGVPAALWASPRRVVRRKRRARARHSSGQRRRADARPRSDCVTPASAAAPGESLARWSPAVAGGSRLPARRSQRTARACNLDPTEPPFSGVPPLFCSTLGGDVKGGHRPRVVSSAARAAIRSRNPALSPSDRLDGSRSTTCHSAKDHRRGARTGVVRHGGCAWRRRLAGTRCASPRNAFAPRRAVSLCTSDRYGRSPTRDDDRRDLAPRTGRLAAVLPDRPGSERAAATCDRGAAVGASRGLGGAAARAGRLGSRDRGVGVARDDRRLELAAPAAWRRGACVARCSAPANARAVCQSQGRGRAARRRRMPCRGRCAELIDPARTRRSSAISTVGRNGLAIRMPVARPSAASGSPPTSPIKNWSSGSRCESRSASLASVAASLVFARRSVS